LVAVFLAVAAPFTVMFDQHVALLEWFELLGGFGFEERDFVEYVGHVGDAELGCVG
jgi:hypothetical protein